MRVTYVISIKVPIADRDGHIPVGLDVEINRTCALGNATRVFKIRDLSEVTATATSILSYIPADLANLVTQLSTQTTNAAIKAALELAVGDLTVSFDI